MACFLVPTVEAVAVGVAAKITKTSDKKAESNEKAVEEITGLTWGEKLNILKNMLIGGAVLLCFEHVWHGEVVPFFPFLTAMTNPGEAAEMLTEMGTVGVTMASIVTVAWGGVCAAADYLVKKAKKVTA